MWTGEYIGIFVSEDAHFLEAIFQTTIDYCHTLDPHNLFYLPVKIFSFTIGGRSMQLSLRNHPNGREGEDFTNPTLRRVRVISIPQRARTGNHGHQLFAGITSQMMYDPGRWRWQGHG
jgi:hypothetical protein